MHHNVPTCNTPISILAVSVQYLKFKNLSGCGTVHGCPVSVGTQLGGNMVGMTVLSELGAAQGEPVHPVL